MSERALLLLWTVALCAGMPAWAAPSGETLIDFENPAVVDSVLASTGNPECAVVSGMASQGTRSLKMSFQAYEPGDPQWPACEIPLDKVGASGDWSQYPELSMDLHVQSTTGVLVKIVVTSGEAWQRIAARTVQPGQWETLRVALWQVADQIDLSAIDTVRLVLTRPANPAVIHLDNLRLVAPDISEERSFDWVLVSPSYHQGFFHSKPEDDVTVQWQSRLVPDSDPGGELRVVLERENEQRIAERVIADPSARSGRIQFDRPTMADGERIRLTMAGVSQGKEHWRRSLWITQYPPAPAKEVTLRDDGITLVGGEPFFPLGFYSTPASEFATIEAMGCNAVHSYSPVDAEYMKAAERAGVMVLPRVAGRAERGLHIYHDPREDDARAHHYIDTLKESPALLGYYLYDEPNPGSVPRDLLLELCDVFRAADPYHLAAGCNNSYQAAYYRVADAMMVDSYPIPGPMDQLISRSREGAQAQKPTAAMWFIPQAFNWETHFSGPLDGGRHGRRRLPTFDEVRTMPWLAVALGAKGLFYYSFQTQGFYHKNAYPWFWYGLERHVAETAALLPWLTERAPNDAPHCSTEHVLVAARRRDEDVLIVAANAAREAIDASITVPALDGRTLHVLSEDRTITPAGNVLSDRFNPMETHIYLSRPGPALRKLPTLDQVRADIARRKSEYFSANPSEFTYRKGARLHASWGFPDPESVGRKIWYRMIDGYPGTQWVVGHAYRHPNPERWRQKDFDSAGRWVEVRVPEAKPVNHIRAVTRTGMTFDLQVPDGDSWQTLAIETGTDSPSRHHVYTTATTTARFDAHRIDRFRIVFPQPRNDKEVILELAAWLGASMK